MFTHLHVHTEYSLLDGMCPIGRLLSRAKELGMESVAITDHGNMYGVIEFYLAAKEAGINPLIGCEVYVAPFGRHSKTNKDKDSYHLVLLARNNVGYQNLLQLTTKAHLQGFYYKPRVDRELLEQHSDGLIALSACLHGEIPRLLLDGRDDEATKAALWYKEVFSDFYLEIQRHPKEELDKVNPGLIAMSRSLTLPLVATNDTHYVCKDESFAHELLLCIQTNTTVYDEKRLRIGDTFYLRSADEMKALYSDLPQALLNTERIAEMCQVKLDFGRLHLPEINLPDGRSADEYLSDLCREGLAQRSGQPSEMTLKRLEYELDIIAKTNFANYFLVVWDLISFARRNNILYGVRGSAAASLVLYTLGITNVNPLEHKLVFERFLNLERREMPDIDIDFQDDRRDEMISYIAQKYGHDHVAQIITFGTFGARAALRDVGRALGMPYGDVDRLARLVPFGPNMTLEKALAETQELKKLYQENEGTRQLIDNARSIEGIARHASTHAAGVVISKDPLSLHVPLQKPIRADEDATVMTQFPMEAIAQIGLLKLDVLGLVNLTVLHKTKEIVAETMGVNIDLDQIPLDDTKTYALLSSGQTTGVFQLEGTGMRRFVKELKPSTFSDIAAMIALYRPGPMQHIPTFIKAKRGLTPIHFPHPTLSQILQETYGVIVYQDQVLLIVQAFAGYSLGQADIFRKAMGKKIASVMEKERDNFIAGAKRKGFSEELAVQVFDLIEPFAGYAFNKAHSVSYAMIAYQTAYLKANYPAEYMTAVLAMNMGQPDKVSSAVSECRRLGIPVLPPDINRSTTTFSIEAMNSKKAIRFGLGAIKNVGVSAVAPIVASQQNCGEFKNIEDFCHRADLRNVNRRVLESLIKAGAFDCLGSRGSLLSSIDRIISLSQSEQRLKESGQVTMFDLWGKSVPPPIPDIQLQHDEITPNERLAWEKELLGIYLSEHPFSHAAKKLGPLVTTFCGQIDESMVGQGVTVAGIVTSPRQLHTKEGRPFVSAILEDLDGRVEVTAWPDVYEVTKELWSEGSILLVEGRVRFKGEQVQLTCDTVRQYHLADTPDSASLTRRRRLVIILVQTADETRDVESLHEVLDVIRDFPGDDEVRIRVVTNDRTIELEFPDSTTAYCPELHQRLSNLVGESNLLVQ